MSTTHRDPLTRRFSTLVLAGVCSFAPAGAAHAQFFGGLRLDSDRIERGVSSSQRKPSVGGHIGWRHDSGLSASLGAASVSDEVYVGSHGYTLRPELAWNGSFGADDSWRTGLALRGQYFPGAFGSWSGSLPPAVQGRLQRATESDYSTVELAATLGWKHATLTVSRSLTDYLGLASTDTGPAGTRAIESTGTTYVGLDIAWPLTPALTLRAGAGRLHVPNFESLDYSDWRLGLALQAWGLEWGLQASGSNAHEAWQSRRRGSGPATSGNADTTGNTLQAWVAWSF